MRTTLLRFSTLAVIVCTGLAERIGTSKPGAQSSGTVHTQENEGVGGAGNGQDSSEFYAW